MNTQDFLDTYPSPPRIAKGVSKKTISVVVAEIEWEIITKLANHPVLRESYHGHISDVMRHAMYYLVHELNDYVDSNWRPLTQQLNDELAISNHTQTGEAVQNWLDRRCNRLLTYVDLGLFTEALQEYTELLADIRAIPPRWRMVVQNMMVSHLGLKKFMERVEKSSQENLEYLKEILDFHNDELDAA